MLMVRTTPEIEAGLRTGPLVTLPDLRFPPTSKSRLPADGSIDLSRFDAAFITKRRRQAHLCQVRLIHGDCSVELRARLDTGRRIVSLTNPYADIFGLTESGVHKQFRTVTRSVKAFGHFRYPVVFFHAMRNPAYASVGRRGWLDRVRLGITHYEQRLLLGQYSR